jgi:sporulation protein YlmC with PRC-barrel domain
MEIGNGVTLVPLGEQAESPGGGQQDLRSRRVFDKAGEEIGNVRDLLLDDANGQIQYLIVAADYTIDTTLHEFAIPVDAIARLEPDRLFLDHLRERVLSGPIFDATSPPPPDYWSGLTAYYGYASS